VAELTTVVLDVEVESLDAVGPGAPAPLLDAAHPITVAHHPAVRWTLTSPQAAEAGDATEMVGLIGIVHRETDRCRYLGLGHAPALALALALDP
jgi:hypothetical protein